MLNKELLDIIKKTKNESKFFKKQMNVKAATQVRKDEKMTWNQVIVEQMEIEYFWEYLESRWDKGQFGI